MAGGRPRDWATTIGAPEHARRTDTAQTRRHPILTAVSLSVGALIVLAVTFAVWQSGRLDRDDPGLPGIFIDAERNTSDHDSETLPPISDPRPVLPAPAAELKVPEHLVVSGGEVPGEHDTRPE